MKARSKVIDLGLGMNMVMAIGRCFREGMRGDRNWDKEDGTGPGVADS